ncbi:TMEM101 protein family [Fasciola hepatica]|uniref:TMEM101 protein family n=1 Tax=Fasciola hepatica TaxID=6192 RepID=A0A4E0RDL8_FASHE|nr:TMEM101 protein family [Fasciola hepatica]
MTGTTATDRIEKSPKAMKRFVYYPFLSRCLHWILARIALIQTVTLFLWLAERARNETQPPLRPWIIYLHAFVGLVGSTGLSARLLPRAALYALTALQLHTSYIYAFHSRMIYSHWLRMRFALHSLAASGVYLRMLGAGTIPLSGESSRVPSVEYGLYAFGVTLISAFSAVSGLLHFPLGLVTVDRETQLLEQSSIWPVFSHLNAWISGCLTVVFLAGSLAYSAPLLLTGMKHSSSVAPTDTSDSSVLERASRLGDQFIIVGVVALTLFYDTHVPYWVSIGSEFWLQIRLLLDNFIIVSGILITSDLFSESRRIRANDSAKKE